MDSIKEKYEAIRRQLPEGVTLVAVSKTKTVEDIRTAYAAGVRDFGENKVQELEEKQPQLPGDIRWHFIGGLQTNKVRKIIGKTHLIQSVDRISLAQEIEKRAVKAAVVVDVLLEVNIGAEENKGGVLVEDLPELIRSVSEMPHIRAKGLMAIIPLGEEAQNRYWFQEMRKLFEDLKQEEREGFSMDILSMGMSGDFATAVEEGANMVRIGEGIFGKRNG